MTEEVVTDKKLSRRQFVGTAAAGAAVLGAGAFVAPKLITGVDDKAPRLVAPAAQPVQGVPTSWDYEADVVCVGLGNAGTTAAICANDAGAQVLVLEKAPFQGGGSFRMSGGDITYCATDVTDAANYAYAISFGQTPYDVCMAWATESANTPAWLDSLGVKYSHSISPEYPGLPGSSSMGMAGLTGGGNGQWPTFDAQVQSRPITILFNTQGTHLIQNPQTSEIIGVQAQQWPIPDVDISTVNAPLPIPTTGGTTINIKARRAVILTTGGIMYNEVHKSNFLSVYPFTAYSWRYDTGDGLRMAQEVGADLWHTASIFGRGDPWFVDLYQAGYVGGFIGGTPHGYNWITVNKYGNRFCNEELGTHAFVHFWTDFNPLNAENCPEYTRIPSYCIWDSTSMAAGAMESSTGGSLCIPVGLGGVSSWSSDNSAEVAKGWIQTGKDIPTLVANLNVQTPTDVYLGQLAGHVNGYVPALNPTIVAATITRWNGFCATSPPVDLDFGRPASTMAPIVTAPFYGWRLWPACSDAGGGPRRNANSQVVDTSGNPIPRLYEAGAVGAWLGTCYTTTGGGLNTDGITFGRIAGRNAAGEKPWTTT